VTFSGSNNTIEEDRMNLKKEIESAFKDVLQTDDGQITLKGKAKNGEV